MFRHINIRTNGSVIVDAAIALPVFIIAIGMLLQVINITAKEEHGYFDAATRIEAVGLFGSDLNLGQTVNDSVRHVSIDHVQFYPIIKNVKFPFAGALFDSQLLSMDMPYKTYIGESRDYYGDDEFVYIFPKNEGNEREGPKYHTCYCQTMKAGATKGLSIEKITKDEAVARGYTICKWCLKQKK